MLYKVFLTFILILVINFSANSQCQGNLIKNGSFELDTVGVGIPATFWEIISGTPDIENDQDSQTAFGTNFAHGMPQSSIDGGNWQNIGYTLTQGSSDTFPESFGQSIAFNKSIPHLISFEFAFQAYVPTFKAGWYGAVDVLINNEVVHTTELDTTLYTFEKVSFFYVPKEQNVTIGFRVNTILNRSNNKFVAIDGVCVSPVAQGRFCEP